MMTTNEQELIREFEYLTKEWSRLDVVNQDSQFGAWSTELQAIADLNQLKGLFFGDDWVYILVDIYASKIAAQELKVQREVIINGSSSYEAAEGHPVNELIYNPNENQTYYEWMYSLVADHCLGGNSIVWNATSLKQLIHLPIEGVQIDFDRDRRVKSYRIVQYTDEMGIPEVNSVTTIPKEFIGHAKRPNPSSPIWGLSPFIPGRKSVLFNRYSLEYLNNFYAKGAQPGLVFEMNEVANEKSALRLLRSIESVHTGRRNQRRNMVVPKGVTVKSIAHTLADQQLKVYIDQNRETIINVLKVPKHELSIATAGSLGSEEYKIALKNFWTGPLKATMTSIAATLTKLLSDQLGPKHFLQFDLSDVDILQEDLLTKSNVGTALLTTHTVNEVRARVFDMEPIEGGDVITSLQPAAFPFQQQFSAPKIETQSVESDDREKILHNNMVIFNELKASTPEWWEKRESLITNGFDEGVTSVHGEVLKLFSDQIASVLGLVKSELKDQGYKSKETFRKSKLKREIRNALSKFEDRWINEMIRIIETRIDLGYDAQLVLPFNLPSKTEIAAAKARNAGRRREFAEDHLSQSFSEINQSTSKKIFRIIEDAIANSSTIEQAGSSIAQTITRNIGNDFTNPDTINSRAMLIAHQEMMTASSLGQAAALEDAADVIPNLMKMWIAAGDNRVRGRPNGLYPDAKADHWHLSGVVVPHDKDFVDSKGNRLAFPRDPNGKLEAIIRCRCSFVMVPKDEADSLGIRSLTSEFQDTNQEQ